MATPKLKLIYNVELESYVYLEKSEGLRVIKILKLLPSFNDWTSALKIAIEINEKIPALLSTLHKLAGAESVSLFSDNEKIVIARRPVLLIRKDEFNSNAGEKKFLRAGVYVKNG